MPQGLSRRLMSLIHSGTSLRRKRTYHVRAGRPDVIFVGSCVRQKVWVPNHAVSKLCNVLTAGLPTDITLC